MGKIKKKYSEGASRTYTTRNRALRKLQVTLADFRRLCILKGIYPVEPRSRKRANRGSTHQTTFYYTKDIQLLVSEPLIAKFREHKIFLRKLQHALGKQDYTRAKGMAESRPAYTLNHLVLERYPAFADALRDLDDALCMVFLFATMPAAGRVHKEATDECRRLATEFMHYVVHTHALRKVFLSIKGIYYQAEVGGQSVTWVVPYQFSQRVPTDVDFRVMATFLQFYRTLLGFVNFRLFTTANLAYPPALDSAMDDSAAGLGALRVEARGLEAATTATSRPADEDAAVKSEPPTATTTTAAAEAKARLGTLAAKMKDIVAADSAAAEAPAYSAVGDNSEDEEAAKIADLLFGRQVLFLSREVPRESLEFVVRAHGGRVGWDRTSGGGSPYAENDAAITVQIADRPAQGHRFLDRAYVQPQWVYDSVNARRLLPTEDYLVGQPLPPHLSPFVEYAEGDYVPEQAARLAAAAATAAGFEGEVASLRPEDRDQPAESEPEAEAGGADDIDGESADEDEPDSDADEDEGEDEDEDEDEDGESQHQKQLLAERAGVPFSEYQQRQKQQQREQEEGAPKKQQKQQKQKQPAKRTKAQLDEEERERIAISMLSKKKRKVVNRARADAYKKAKDVNALKARRAQAASSSGNGNSRK